MRTPICKTPGHRSGHESSGHPLDILDKTAKTPGHKSGHPSLDKIPPTRRGYVQTRTPNIIKTVDQLAAALQTGLVFTTPGFTP